MSERIKTSICSYCGCACALNFIFYNGELKKVLPVKGDFPSLGKPCIKGLSLNEPLERNRLKYPMIKKNEKPEKVSWQEAYDYIYENMKDLSRDEVYFTGSGEFTNEANYLLSKFARTYFKTNNIDCCARLCHAATANAFREMFGITAIPKYDFTDLEERDLYLLIGTDPKADYPVMYHRIWDAKNRGAKIIVIDVGPSTSSEDADFILKISPNGIVPLISKLIKKIIEKKDFSKDARQFENFGQLVEDAGKIADKFPLNYTNLKPGDFEELYYLVNHAKKPAILYGMGATQQHNGTQNIKAIASLAILLNAVLFSNRGKVNVQGAGDVGACFDFLPAEGCAKDIEKYWGVNIDLEKTFVKHKGQPITEGMYDKKIKAAWIMGMNPAQSMPDLNDLHKSLKNKFVIYQHHHGGVTMDFADVVLPATMLPEEEGTISNGERRVRWVNSIGHDPLIKPNWMIIIETAKKFGLEKFFKYDSPLSVFKEMIKVIPAYSNLDIKKIKSLEGDLADKEAKFTRFPRLRYAIDHVGEENDFPFTLTTARTRYHFCTGEGTRNSERLMKLDPKPLAYLSPNDAERLSIRSGDVIKIESIVGEIEIEVMVDEMVGRKIVIVPFHFDKVLVNKLTPRILDPESGTPCYKEVGVKLTKELIAN